MLTLKEFFGLNHGTPVEVCIKEPEKCASYWTTLKTGESNIHTDCDLERMVYFIGIIHSTECNGNILTVYAW